MPRPETQDDRGRSDRGGRSSKQAASTSASTSSSTSRKRERSPEQQRQRTPPVSRGGQSSGHQSSQAQPSQSSSSRNTGGGDRQERIKPPPVSSVNGELARKIHNASYLAMEKEEEIANERAPGQNYEDFREKVAEAKTLLQQLSSSVSSGNSNDITSIKKELILTVGDMKVLNRLDKLRSRTSREAVSKIRGRVDECHLRLQNLLYEVMFIEREIKRSLDYKSRADDVELDELERFYKNVPENIFNPEKISSMENGERQHHLTLARLEWELKQRMSLAEQLQESELFKTKDVEDIRNMQELLGRLRSAMTTVLDSLKPVTAELSSKDSSQGVDESSCTPEDRNSKDKEVRAPPSPMEEEGVITPKEESMETF